MRRATPQVTSGASSSFQCTPRHGTAEAPLGPRAKVLRSNQRSAWAAAVVREVATPRRNGNTPAAGQATGAITDARNKPSSVRPRSDGGVIYLGPPLLTASSSLPGIEAERATPHPLFGLAPGGVYRATPVSGGPVRSYRTLSPLPVPRRAIGGLLSVALSVVDQGRRPGVTRHPCPVELGLSSAGIPKDVDGDPHFARPSASRRRRIRRRSAGSHTL